MKKPLCTHVELKIEGNFYNRFKQKWQLFRKILAASDVAIITGDGRNATITTSNISLCDLHEIVSYQHIQFHLKDATAIAGGIVSTLTKMFSNQPENKSNHYETPNKSLEEMTTEELEKELMYCVEVQKYERAETIKNLLISRKNSNEATK